MFSTHGSLFTGGFVYFCNLNTEEVPPKRRQTSTRLHGVTSQPTLIFTVAVLQIQYVKGRLAKSSVSTGSRIPVILLTIVAVSIPDEVIGFCN
jgi:hypothetical protein